MPCRGESACCAHESKLRTDRSFLTRLRRVFSLPSGFAPTPISHLLPGTACSTTRVCGYDVLLIGRCLEWSVHASLERLWRQQNALLPSSTVSAQAAVTRRVHTPQPTPPTSFYFICDKVHCLLRILAQQNSSTTGRDASLEAVHVSTHLHERLKSKQVGKGCKELVTAAARATKARERPPVVQKAK